MRRITTVAFSFARRIIKKETELQLQSQTYANKPQALTIEEQLQEEIVPFHASTNQPKSLRQYQEGVKKRLIKDLAPNHSEESQLRNIQDEDYNANRLVNRPNKGVVWGLGGQLMLADRKVHLVGVKDTIDDIVDFLELHQVKDIYIHDFYIDDINTNRRRYALIGSCFSAKHCWKTGIELKNAFNANSSTKFHRRTQKYDPIGASMNGSKNQQWSMVEYKEFQVNLMTEQQREAMDLEWKWNNPVSEQRLDKYNKLKLQRGRKNQFQDL